jgi:hypothetical protein
MSEYPDTRMLLFFAQVVPLGLGQGHGAAALQVQVVVFYYVVIT